MSEKMYHYFEQQQNKVQEIKKARVVVEKQEDDKVEENKIAVIVIEKKETPQVASAVKKEQNKVSVVIEKKESLNISVKNASTSRSKTDEKSQQENKAIVIVKKLNR